MFNNLELTTTQLKAITGGVSFTFTNKLAEAKQEQQSLKELADSGQLFTVNPKFIPGEMYVPGDMY